MVLVVKSLFLDYLNSELICDEFTGCSPLRGEQRFGFSFVLSLSYQ